MLICGVILVVVLDLECECDFLFFVFVFLIIDFVLIFGGVFEWIIGVLELIIVLWLILMIFVIFFVFVICFCVGFLLFFFLCFEVLSFDWVLVMVMIIDGGMFFNVCVWVVFVLGVYFNMYVKLYFVLSERKINILIVMIKRIVNKMINY